MMMLWAVGTGDAESLQAMADGGWALAEIVDSESAQCRARRCYTVRPQGTHNANTHLDAVEDAAHGRASASRCRSVSLHLDAARI